MKLVSLKKQSLDGSRTLAIGEVFDISAKSADLLIRLKRAKLYEEPAKKGQYKRRDMRAES